MDVTPELSLLLSQPLNFLDLVLRFSQLEKKTLGGQKF